MPPRTSSKNMPTRCGLKSPEDPLYEVDAFRARVTGKVTLRQGGASGPCAGTLRFNDGQWSSVLAAAERVAADLPDAVRLIRSESESLERQWYWDIAISGTWLGQPACQITSAGHTARLVWFVALDDETVVEGSIDELTSRAHGVLCSVGARLKAHPECETLADLICDEDPCRPNFPVHAQVKACGLALRAVEACEGRMSLRWHVLDSRMRCSMFRSQAMIDAGEPDLTIDVPRSGSSATWTTYSDGTVRASAQSDPADASFLADPRAKKKIHRTEPTPPAPRKRRGARSTRRTT